MGRGDGKITLFQGTSPEVGIRRSWKINTHWLNYFFCICMWWACRCTCSHVCGCTCLCECSCLYKYMHEFDILCLPQMLSTLYIEACSFNDPGAKRQQRKDGEYNCKDKISNTFLQLRIFKAMSASGTPAIKLSAMGCETLSTYLIAYIHFLRTSLCVQCTLIMENPLLPFQPSQTPLPWLPSNFMSSLHSPLSPQCCLYVHGCRVIHRSLGTYRGPFPWEKLTPYPSKATFNYKAQLRVRLPKPLPYPV